MIFQSKCAAELGKFMKYCKNLGKMNKTLKFFPIILMATFGTKNVHSAKTKIPISD